MKINETMQGSALSSWDERLSRGTKSNYDFLTVSKEPLGRLVLASKFREDAFVGWMPSTCSPSSLLLVLVLRALL